MMTKLVQLLAIGASHRVWRALLFALSATLLLAPLIFRPTFTTGPDVGMHIYNIQHFVDEIQAGVWYPRWFGGWYGDYGAPIGVAYPPLTYYSVAILANFGLPTLMALKFILWVSIFASGIIMYKLAAQFMNPLGALIAGLLYQVAPYRVFDLYGRTALPEYLAFMWLPLVILLTLYYIREKRLIHHVILALSIAALIMTHLLITYLFAMVMGLFAVHFVLNSDEQKMRTSSYLVITALFGILLTAVYWLPAFMENQYMNTAWLQQLTPAQLPERQEWGNYLNNFLFSGKAYLGTSFSNIYSENIRISIGAVLSIVLGGLALTVNICDWHQRPPQTRDMSLIMTVVLALSIFMSFSISRPLWTVLPRAEIIQFPWRWLTIASLAVAYLTGDVIDWIFHRWLIKRSSLKLHQLILILILICTTSIYVLYSGTLMWRYRSRLTDHQVQQFLGIQPLSLDNYGWVFDEFYLPKWGLDFNYMTAPSKQPIISNASIETEIQQWHSQNRAFTVSAPTDTTINVRTFWFPGWRVEVNEQTVAVDIHPDDGTMLFQIPAGDSEVKLTFENTPVRTVGTIISGATALILIGLTMLAGYQQLSKRGESHV